MYSAESKAKLFIKSLLFHPVIQNLKLVDDKGINVTIHTYDVLKIAEKHVKREFFSNISDKSKKPDIFSLVVGIVIHDTTKATLRLNSAKMSHSYIMNKHPEIVRQEANGIISDVEKATGVKLKEKIVEHILHIVVSHHGDWGKIRPETTEARIVADADKYSALHHRITPIGAKRIVQLMAEGHTREEIVKLTGFTEGIINDRLKRSKKHLNLTTNRELIRYYRIKGTLPEGDEFFSRRMVETERLINKVNRNGFENLVIKSELMEIIFDQDVFEEETIGKQEQAAQ